ncbi:MAG: sensor histidine kinase [Deltaproteobacteria bacterium]|nr:sensor histidine kinase [Deltaproteobacteria bacterium]
MSWKSDIIGETGLQFYGKTSASLSHEIKNVLAIINEHAGLLKDFALIAEAGTPMDQGRLKGLAEKVMKQIRRADGIVTTMNRFAHSVDESIKDVDLGEILEFGATLSRRLASMRGVTLEPMLATTPVRITTNPFFLQNLLSLCVDFAMVEAGGGKTVGLLAEETKNGARIRVTGLRSLAEVPANTFPTKREKTLLEALKAELEVGVEAGELVITLSRDMD